MNFYEAYEKFGRTEDDLLNDTYEKDEDVVNEIQDDTTYPEVQEKTAESEVIKTSLSDEDIAKIAAIFAKMQAKGGENNES